jgi:hypothetical protein
MVCGFSALCAEKPHTEDGKYHAAAGKKRGVVTQNNATA